MDGPKAVDPKPPIKAAGLGGMLAGAELQAAILQRRGQLRPTPSAAVHTVQVVATTLSDGGDVGSGAEKAVSGSVGRGLLGVLSRGLERVHQQIWQQPAPGGTVSSSSRGFADQSLVEDDETGGNFEFLQALARRKQAGGGQ